MDNEKLTLTIAETAKILGLSKGKTYEEAKLGRLPVIRFGRRILVPRKAFERMLEQVGPQHSSDTTEK